MKKVIDVSSHQGNIQWSKVKNAVDGAIIRLGYRGYSTGRIVADSYAKVNITGAKAQGVPFGVYFFPCSITTAEAYEEADWIHNQVKDLDLSFPIYLDSEVADTKFGKGRADNLSRTDRTNLLLALISRLKSYGYTVGVYASKSWFTSRLDASKFPSDCRIWVAQYATNCSYKGKITAWQYTSKAICDGISGNVDMSYYYEDFGSATVTAQNPYPEPTRLLYRTKPLAQRGDDVKWLQYELIRHGCLSEKNSKGKSNIDGILGNDTSNAIGKFQKKVGIAVDKKCGIITRTYLKK